MERVRDAQDCVDASADPGSDAAGRSTASVRSARKWQVAWALFRQMSYAGEFLHTSWRFYPDAFGLMYMCIVDLIPLPYFMLKGSLCSSATQLPFVQSIPGDELLASFPCPDTNITGTSGKGAELSNFMLAFFLEPAAARWWYVQRCWWVWPYVMTRHAFMFRAGCLVGIPIGILLSFLAAQWWFTGGRTLLLVVWRPYGLLFNLLKFILDPRWKERIWHQQLQFSTGGLLMRQLVCRAFMGAVPWKVQLPLVLLESLLTMMVWLAHCNFHPPSLLWLLNACCSTCLVAAVLLAASAAESLILSYMHPRLTQLHRDAPHGPLHALRTLCCAAAGFLDRCKHRCAMVLLVASYLLLFESVLWVLQWDLPLQPGMPGSVVVA